jgi:succinoglycan biosynthesis protein ExoW
MTAVAVVIPYFQRRAGILRRAVTSILQQRLAIDTRVEIIVVDDGSPVPARTEIEALDIASPFQLRLAEQPNSGVAAARNKALSLITVGTTYIAFLDSDDTWHPLHLATAIAALNLGYDFYFCDGRRIGNVQSTFNERLPGGTAFQDFLNSAAAQLIGPQLYNLRKAALFSQSLRTPGYKTPAVVYRRAASLNLTFDPALREVGEDSLFLLQLISLSRKICCSTQELASFEDGINIYASKFTWDNPGHLSRYMGTLLFHYRLQHTFSFAPDDARLVSARIRLYRRLFAFLTVRYFLKKREPWPRQLIDMTRRDPTFWLWYPAWALTISTAYVLRLYDPIKRGDIHHPAAGRA